MMTMPAIAVRAASSFLPAPSSWETRMLTPMATMR